MSDAKHSTPQNSAGQPVNTLRLEGTALGRVQEALDASEAAREKAGQTSSVRREHKRWQFRHGGIPIEIQHPNGHLVSLLFACRNLSAGGMAVLHSAYMHPGTKVSVQLNHHTQGPTQIPGVVKRCRHVTGKLHEVGIKFAQPIELASFLEVDPFKGQFSVEAVKEEKLSGKLLQVEDGPLDRRLLRHLLEATRLVVTSVETAQEALAKAKEPWDVILVDVQLPGGISGLDLVEKLRAEGVQVPIIMVTADKTQVVRERAKAVRANGVISKPFRRETLLAALAEFLLNTSLGADSGGAIMSTLRADDPMARFVPDFVKELNQAATRLRAAMKSGDIEAVRLECFQIVGVAGTLGLDPVSRSADEALRSVNASGSLGEAARPVQDLIASCMRVRMGHAA
jgi:CheY-like chemotaxis protein